jgi:hypothetical protein
MMVASRATLSGIIRTPFFSTAGQGVSGGIHHNIRLDLCLHHWALVGCDRLRANILRSKPN